MLTLDKVYQVWLMADAVVLIDTRTLVERNLDAIAILSQSSGWTEKDEAGD